MKEERDRMLFNANSLIAEIDQIKKEFAQVETQAQNTLAKEISNLKTQNAA